MCVGGAKCGRLSMDPSLPSFPLRFTINCHFGMFLNRTLFRPAAHLLYAQSLPSRHFFRTSSTAAPSGATTEQPDQSSPQIQNDRNKSGPSKDKTTDEEIDSPLTRRFTAMAESAMEASPRRASQIAKENDFSDELKRKLESRLAATDFQSKHASAFAVASLPSAAGKHTREIASSAPWTGTESSEDAVLRMLVDAHQPLKGDLAKPPKNQGPANIDLRPRKSSLPSSAPARIARARDKSTEYTLNKSTLTPQEQSDTQQMFRERFLPEGRPVVSLQGLASLADEKIADAMASGKFKNLPRGKPLERDHNAESPYLDTTEYFLNRIIQRQEIVPPWIEKQQELVKAVNSFRTQLRKKWRRHVARTIASHGGTLEEQISRAEKYAAAENPQATNQQQEAPSETTAKKYRPVFRDQTWEKTESAYHSLAIKTLNSLTRSYNLLAPELAKKPYLSLPRELEKCFIESAPLIAQEIRERANTLSSRERVGNEQGILGKLGEFGTGKEKVVVYDEVRPRYGFRELWKDLFGR